MQDFKLEDFLKMTNIVNHMPDMQQDTHIGKQLLVCIIVLKCKNNYNSAYVLNLKHKFSDSTPKFDIFLV